MKRIKLCLVLMVAALIVKLSTFVILVHAAALAPLYNSLSIVLAMTTRCSWGCTIASTSARAARTAPTLGSP